MKNEMKYFGIIAIVAVIVFSMAACGDGAGGGNSGNSGGTSATYTGEDDEFIYELVITSSSSGARAAYNPKNGDSYVLKITSKDGTMSVSMGKVGNVAGAVFTLVAEGVSFTVTITADKIDKTEGVIPKIDLVYTRVSAFAEVLEKLPANIAFPASSPYVIKLNVSDFRGDNSNPIGIALPLKVNKTKYVNLDLSGSTFTTMPGDLSGFRDCTNLVGITIPGSVTRVHTPLLSIAL
jgi:hypothetical protein